jgi:hypothetical protein
MGGQSLVNINGSYEVMKPIIQALELEGYYETKPACDNRPYLVNPDDPTCLHGSSWNMRVSQPTMGGTLPNPTMFLLSNDNFHDVQETNPVHLAEIDTTCEVDSENCIINAVTVT